MTVKPFHSVDKSRWPKGPWTTEPDLVVWLDADSRLQCIIIRHPAVGHLCGYVGVPADHPAHGLNYDGLAWADSQEKTRRWGNT